jgi:hypothetical protein
MFMRRKSRKLGLVGSLDVNDTPWRSMSLSPWRFGSATGRLVNINKERITQYKKQSKSNNGSPDVILVTKAMM